MIYAGKLADISWVTGTWLILDIGFSNKARSCGLLIGDSGLWSRWACYMGTGHGWNDEMVSIINENGIKYAREHFRFSILEVMVKSTPDDAVMDREAHWKRVLLTREHGYNKN